MTRFVRSTALVLAAGASVAIGMIGSKLFGHEIAQSHPLYVSSYNYGSQREIVAVLIVSSTCGATEDPSLPSSLDRLRGFLSEAGRASGSRPVFSAVAVDWRPATGLRVLEKLGPFDEVVSGRQWLSTGLAYYGRIDPRFEMTVPQILLLERTVVFTPLRLEVREERMLQRIVGIQAINRFAETELLQKIVERSMR